MLSENVKKLTSSVFSSSNIERKECYEWKKEWNGWNGMNNGDRWNEWSGWNEKQPKLRRMSTIHTFCDPMYYKFVIRQKTIRRELKSMGLL